MDVELNIGRIYTLQFADDQVIANDMEDMPYMMGQRQIEEYNMWVNGELELHQISLV